MGNTVKVLDNPEMKEKLKIAPEMKEKLKITPETKEKLKISPVQSYAFSRHLILLSTNSKYDSRKRKKQLRCTQIQTQLPEKSTF